MSSIKAAELEKRLRDIQRVAAGIHAHIASATTDLGTASKARYDSVHPDDLKNLEILVDAAGDAAERISRQIGEEVDKPMGERLVDEVMQEEFGWLKRLR